MRVVVSQYEGIDATPVLPLAAGTLIATARRQTPADYEIAIERAPIERAVAALGTPDLLGLSLYPWNATYSLAVAAAARRAHPDLRIVAGGPSVPRRPERARRFLDDHPAIDIAVFSEGELGFAELVRGQDPAAIPGLAIRGAPHLFTAPPDRVYDFTQTGSPFLDGTFDQLCARHRDRFAMALLETNRGCPFSCTFCDWSLTKKVVEVPLARVHAELAWVVEHGFSHVMLADANFGIRPRDADLARHVADLRRATGRPSTFYWYLTKNDHRRNLETIEILHEAAIGTWVGLAVQDFDDDVLEAVKRDNIQTGEALRLRAICAERGIPTFHELILGLPGQTYRSFTETIATAMPAIPRHDFVLFLCRLIDNSDLASPESRAQHGIETRRCQWKSDRAGWDPIVDEVQEVVVATKDLPLADWQRAYRFAFLAAALYNLRLLRVVLACVPDLRDALERLADLTVSAAPGSVYAEIGAAFDRYLSSMLAGGPMVLPVDDAPILIDEAILRLALARHDDFLAETAAALPGYDDAFRYQALITPRWNQPDVRQDTFDHDWPGFAAGGPLAAGPTTVRFVPPSYVAMPTFAGFAATHQGCVRARLDIGSVDSAPLRIRLPASG